MLRHVLLVCLAVAASVVAQDGCPDVDRYDRVDCGESGTDEGICTGAGCCWDPLEEGSSEPWCFFPEGSDQAGTCDPATFVWEADSPGFTSADLDVIYTNFLSQFNWLGTGAVVAAPDNDTPGGDYEYHWMRDGALSIKTLMDINNDVLDADVRAVIDEYVNWVEVVQHQPDANVDVRCEPKFYIESMLPYDGGWCRPQNDGPALRAMALCKFGNILLANGEDTSRIWQMATFDLEWVLENYDSDGCDLWEEVNSNDFYWNRMAYVYSLNEVGKFADAIGEDSAPYYAKAEEIRPTAEAHWNGDFIYESTNREQDTAVLHAIATFGEYSFDATSAESASTITRLAQTFCNEYPINQADNDLGEPGMLFGRYPGDSYAGGNPWQLLTAVSAEVFYLGGSVNTDRLLQLGENFPLDREEHKAWIKLLKLDENATMLDLLAGQMAAGDAVMTRLYKYTSPDAGRVDEQIDKFTGEQASAASLTWSYANILHALWVRGDFNAKLEEAKAKFGTH